MNKGEAVYCEKPMVHKINQGLEVIEAQQRTKKTLQVGSQVVSSIAFAKAKELYKAGEIGQLTCIEANNDRQSALGALEYTMPTDASPKTVDWDRYIANAEGTLQCKEIFLVVIIEISEPVWPGIFLYIYYPVFM